MLTPEKYLAALPADRRAALETVCKAVRAACPDVVEGVSYGMPAFLWNNKAIMGFVSTTKHLSYFPMSGKVVASLEKELKGFDTSKGTIRFTSEKPLPATLVKKLVKARMAEIADKPEKKPAKKESQSDPSVETFLKELDHSLKPEYVAVRKLILGIDPSITEGIKWNAPSFRTSDDFATLHIRTTDRVQFIFHTGAKKKGIDMKAKAIPDPNGLIQWLASDRCMVTLGSGEELKANRKAFVSLVRAWISRMET